MIGSGEHDSTFPHFLSSNALQLLHVAHPRACKATLPRIALLHDNSCLLTLQQVFQFISMLPLAAEEKGEEPEKGAVVH
jgi:hypothetical protein